MMNRDEIMALSGDQALVAAGKEVGWCQTTTYRNLTFPLIAARKLEQEITSRGLQTDYADQVVGVVTGCWDHDVELELDLFALIHASAEQRCKAALITMTQAKELSSESTATCEP